MAEEVGVSYDEVVTALTQELAQARVDLVVARLTIQKLRAMQDTQVSDDEPQVDFDA